MADDGRGHAIDRTIAGAPYLQFIYTQLDYPFAANDGGTVQLQGIGMSLLNVLCSELRVTVNKTDRRLQLTYQAGRLGNEARDELAAQQTDTAVSGTVHAALQPELTNEAQIEHWLMAVLTAHPRMKLHFNGKVVCAPSQRSRKIIDPP